MPAATVPGGNGIPAVPAHRLESVMAAPFGKNVYPTSADSLAFWLYTSGTTGRAKAAMHRHGAIPVVCETYGTQVPGIRPDDGESPGRPESQ
jgi:benzoate-CoA ligase